MFIQKSKQLFLQQAIKVHGNKYDYSLIPDRQKRYDKLKIFCLKHNILFQQIQKNHLNGAGCCKCRAEKVSEKKIKFATQQLFMQKIKEVHGNKYNYDNVIFNKKLNDKIKIICKKHGIFEQDRRRHLYGRGCPTCQVEDLVERNKRRTKTQEQFIKQVRQIHKDRYDYSLVKYINNDQKIEIICKKHGPFWQRRTYHLNRKSGCPICWSSKGQLRVKNFLQRKNISYVKNKWFKNCKRKRYLYFDFYLPKQNICIQYDGKQHFEPVNFTNFTQSGLAKQFQDVKAKDAIKNRFCKSQNIKLIRIPYKQFSNVQKILQEQLMVA